MFADDTVRRLSCEEEAAVKTIAVVVDDIYEDLELWYPRIRLEEQGWKVIVAGPEAGKVYAGKHGYLRTSCAVTRQCSLSCARCTHRGS
jgi:putative intracellular protease/amidase